MATLIIIAAVYVSKRRPIAISDADEAAAPTVIHEPDPTPVGAAVSESVADETAAPEEK